MKPAALKGKLNIEFIGEEAQDMGLKLFASF